MKALFRSKPGFHLLGNPDPDITNLIGILKGFSIVYTSSDLYDECIRLGIKAFRLDLPDKEDDKEVNEYVSNIKFIWWNCASREQTFEGNSKDENMMFFSGFDGSALGILLGNGPDEKQPSKKLTPEEAVVKVLTQEILNYIEK